MTAPREGWAAGFVYTGRWLTISGTHWEPATLYDTQQEATEHRSGDMVVRYVREVWHPGVESGRAYKVVGAEDA